MVHTVREGLVVEDSASHVLRIHDDKHVLLRSIPLPKVVAKAEVGSPFATGEKLGPAFPFDDGWWVVKATPMVEDPSQTWIELLRREEEGWTPRLRFSQPLRVSRPGIFPYGKDRFLLVTTAPLPPGATGSWSPLQVWRRHGEGLAFESALEVDALGQRDMIQRVEAATLHATLLADHLVLTAAHRAHLWVFDLKGGRRVLSRSLFPLPAFALEGSFGLLSHFPVILGLYPGREGRMLVLARTRRAVEEEASLTANMNAAHRLPTPTGDERNELAGRAMAQSHDLILAAHPVQWWELDVQTGSLAELPVAPKGGPEWIHTRAELDRAQGLRQDGKGGLRSLP